MKTEKEIIMEMAKLVDEALTARHSFPILMQMADVEGIERGTRESLLTLADEIYARKW